MSRTAIIVGPEDHGRRMTLGRGCTIVLSAAQSIKTRHLLGLDSSIATVFAAAANNS